MSDDRPSIAELQELVAHGATHLPAIRDATPVLLEIVKAALAWAESDDEDRQSELDVLLAALAKVRR